MKFIATKSNYYNLNIHNKFNDWHIKIAFLIHLNKVAGFEKKKKNSNCINNRRVIFKQFTQLKYLIFHIYINI